jgi:glucose/arabinose dehydrogenase
MGRRHDQCLAVRRRSFIVVLFAATLWRVNARPAFAIVTPDNNTVVPQGDAPEEGDDVALIAVAGPLERPWSIAFLPDRILVTELPGRLRIIDGDRLLSEEINGVPEVLSGGHAGLFDIALDPDFVHNRRLYLSYVHGTEEAATVRVMPLANSWTALFDDQHSAG